VEQSTAKISHRQNNVLKYSLDLKFSNIIKPRVKPGFFVAKNKNWMYNCLIHTAGMMFINLREEDGMDFIKGFLTGPVLRTLIFGVCVYGSYVFFGGLDQGDLKLALIGLAIALTPPVLSLIALAIVKTR
jgi:hypothetical protein